jgi:hypothetical protein
VLLTFGLVSTRGEVGIQLNSNCLVVEPGAVSSAGKQLPLVMVFLTHPSCAVCCRSTIFAPLPSLRWTAFSARAISNIPPLVAFITATSVGFSQEYIRGRLVIECYMLRRSTEKLKI